MPPPRGAYVQAGLGAVPGAGIQVAYLSLRSFYTREVVLYADVSPSFGGGEGSVQPAASIGASLRILGTLRTVGNTVYGGYDVDVGLRLGPGLLFPFKESREAKNQRFSLFLEPFARLTRRLPSGRLFFAEAGVQRPLFRAGFLFPLGTR